MTVAIVALAAASMTRMANRSLMLVAQGTRAHRELTQRWIRESCRLCVLNRASELFVQQDRVWKERGGTYPYPSSIELMLKLDEQPLSLVLKDEQARLNVNRLGRNNLELHSVLAQFAVADSIPIHLQPLPEQSRTDGKTYASWGQIVDFSRLSSPQLTEKSLDALSETFTCWGSGKVNIFRAGDEVLRLAAKGILKESQIQELLLIRHQHNGTIDQLWQAMELHRQIQLRLAQVIDVDSSCFSLQISHAGASSGRVELYVQENSAHSSSPVKVFRW